LTRGQAPKREIIENEREIFENVDIRLSAIISHRLESSDLLVALQQVIISYGFTLSQVCLKTVLTPRPVFRVFSFLRNQISVTVRASLNCLNRFTGHEKIRYDMLKRASHDQCAVLPRPLNARILFLKR